MGIRRARYFDQSEPDKSTIHSPWETRSRASRSDSSPGNPYGIPAQAHSVLAIDFVDEPGHPTRAALDRVLSFQRERLQC